MKENDVTTPQKTALKVPLISVLVSQNPAHGDSGPICKHRPSWTGPAPVSSISVEQVEEYSVHPISSRDENDSQSSTEEVSQLFTSTSRGAFPQK